MSQATQQTAVLPAIEPIAALHMACMQYPGGITALAKRIGRSPGHLHNKFADGVSAYEITDREADALAAMVRAKTGDNSYIQAKCAQHGGIFVAWPETGEAGDEDVLHALLTSMHDLGEMAQEVANAKSDGVVTPEEYAGIEMSGRKLVGQIHAFLTTLRTQVRELPQPAPKVASGYTGVQLCGGTEK